MSYIAVRKCLKIYIVIQLFTSSYSFLHRHTDFIAETSYIAICVIE